MKRYLISSVVVLMVLAVAWIAFAQPQGDFRERMDKMREAQAKAVEVIQQQAAKLKAGMEQPAFDRAQFQEMSEEERAKLKETWTKRREERQQALAGIEQQIMILKGGRQLQAEHDESIAELQAIHAQAVKEKATETAKSIQALIDKRTKTLEDTAQKLGIRLRRGRGQRGEQ
jgi:type II secretory pathway component PulM